MAERSQAEMQNLLVGADRRFYRMEGISRAGAASDVLERAIKVAAGILGIPELPQLLRDVSEAQYAIGARDAADYAMGSNSSVQELAATWRGSGEDPAYEGDVQEGREVTARVDTVSRRLDQLIDQNALTPDQLVNMSRVARLDEESGFMRES